MVLHVPNDYTFMCVGLKEVLPRLPAEGVGAVPDAAGVGRRDPGQHAGAAALHLALTHAVGELGGKGINPHPRNRIEHQGFRGAWRQEISDNAFVLGSESCSAYVSASS